MIKEQFEQINFENMIMQIGGLVLSAEILLFLTCLIYDKYASQVY